MTAARRAPLFPLVRHLSQRVTPLLVRLPISANQLTAATIVAGLACGWAMKQGSRAWALWGALFLFAAYVFDNCDGEVARLKNQSSEFGRRFDNLADWLVHLVFFAALGIGVYRASGETLWLWLGGAAAVGTTINPGSTGSTVWPNRTRGGASPAPRASTSWSACRPNAAPSVS